MKRSKRWMSLLLGMVCLSVQCSAADVIVGVDGTAKDERDSERETIIDNGTEVEWNGILVAIDAGHQGSWVDMSAPEPMAPGSSVTKARATHGTQGAYSNVPEYELNLQVSLLLRDELERRGYHVLMAREDNDTAISNMERAQLATKEGADISVRIHANGSDDHGAAGALTYSPTAANPYLGTELSAESFLLAQKVLDSYCEATGLANLGVIAGDDMTGINWSTVPVTIVEMGFMTNEHDDYYMTDPDNQVIMAAGIADGIDAYFAEEEETVIE